MKRFMVYAIVFVVGFIGVSLFSFYVLVHPTPIEITQTPEGVGLPEPESITLTTSDNVEISGWHFPSSESPERVLLLLHGYPANKRDLLSFAHDLYPAFSVMLIDFRAFGESGGRATTLGIHEPRDVRAATDFLDARGYEHIGVFGYSIGGAIALEAAHRDAAGPEHIDAVATYGAFADLRSLGYDSYRHLSLLKYPLVELLNLWARVFFGAWAHTVSPEHAVPHISAPLFVGHAVHDDVIPFSHAKRLAKAAADNAQLSTRFFQDIRHIGLPYSLPAELTRFFNAAFARTP